MPKPTCAVVGARPDRSTYGNKALRAHQMAGYEVYAVNVRGGPIRIGGALRGYNNRRVLSTIAFIQE